MLRMAISYKKRQAAKALAFNADELYTRLIQELDRARIFVDADSSAARSSSTSIGAVLPPATSSSSSTAATASASAATTKKDAETSGPSTTKK